MFMLTESLTCCSEAVNTNAASYKAFSFTALTCCSEAVNTKVASYKAFSFTAPAV